MHPGDGGRKAVYLRRLQETTVSGQKEEEPEEARVGFVVFPEAKWKRSLGRRSQEGLTWARFKARLSSVFPLPPVRVVHSALRSAANL